MKRALGWSGALLLAAMGCTTVRVAQKDGCWMRRSEKWLSSTKEEVGPCLPPTPAWSEDRLTRMMQECVVRADYRWQSRALEAWERGDNLPERASLDTVLQQCLSEPTRAVLAENDVLRKRLEDMTRDSDALRSSEQAARSSEQAARQQLVGSYEKIATKMTDYLGSAANKAQATGAPATATATASSDSKGSARTASEHDAKTSIASHGAPVAPGTVVVTTAPPAVKKAAASSRPAAAASPAQPAPACGPAPACASATPCSPPSASAPAPTPAGAPANAAASAPVPPAAAEGAAPAQRAQASSPPPESR